MRLKVKLPTGHYTELGERLSPAEEPTCREKQESKAERLIEYGSKTFIIKAGHGSLEVAGTGPSPLTSGRWLNPEQKYLLTTNVAAVNVLGMYFQS